MVEKVKCAIIGSGNIGTDLLYKLKRSQVLEPVWMVGIDPESEGLKRAQGFGLKVTADGVDGLAPHIETDRIQIAFDATSASAHPYNNKVLTEHAALMIDLTPAAIGPYCIPPVNLSDDLGLHGNNVNMVTCGGQATVPIVFAVSRVQPVDYGEIVATVASRSAGPGTRLNIDEFTVTTARAVESVGGAKKGKAIIILNPAKPALIMRDTVYCVTHDEPDEAAIRESIAKMVVDVERYVPGYHVVNGPLFEGNTVIIFLEVEGLGDYLPKYSGNLDIMTASATRTAEAFAQRILDGDLTLQVA